jgi:hypothetical protein
MKLNDDNFWLYVTHGDVTRKTNIKDRAFDNEWLRLDNDGSLTVKGTNPNASGYAWDGCSPKWAFLDQVWGIPDGVANLATEQRKTYQASLFHDVLYQFGKQTGVQRKETDRLFLECMIENDFLWAYVYYAFVRVFGGWFFDRT